MGTVAVLAARPAAALLAPVLIRQGERVRRDTPVLPEAGGARASAEGHGQPLHVVAIGESTAAGVGVSTQDDGLARHFAAELAARTGHRVLWQLFASTGATAGHTRRELLPRAVQDRHDLALVVLGVNDALRLRGRHAWRRSVADITATLRSVQRPGGRVVLAGVPDLGSFPALPQPLRAVMGLHARGLDRQLRGLARNDPAVQHVPAPDIEADLFAADHFHPSAEAYQLWASHLVHAVSHDWIS